MRQKSRKNTWSVIKAIASCSIVVFAACSQMDEPSVASLSQALSIISENFDSVPNCYSSACYSSGTRCTADFGQMISRNAARPGEVKNLCITDAVFHGGFPGSGKMLSDTIDSGEILYTKNSAATRRQIASAIFRFDSSLSGGTHVVVTTHAKWYQTPGGPDNTYNYGYAVGAGIAQGRQHFFLEDISLGKILLSRPHTFTIGRWYKIQVVADGTGYLELSASHFIEGDWQLVANGWTVTRSPVWLSPTENGGGMLGAIVDSDHVDFDEFNLGAY